jgi:hypothetical protein
MKVRSVILGQDNLSIQEVRECSLGLGCDLSEAFWSGDLTEKNKNAAEVVLYFPNLPKWMLIECKGDKALMEKKLDALLSSVKNQCMAATGMATWEELRGET